VIIVACVGKFGGSAVAARAAGFGWRESSAIGILMNTRGLMQLVILTIGRDLGVITTAVFVMMVLMAIITTFLTTPILHWVYPAAAVALPGEAAKAGRRFTVLVPVSRPASGPALAALADLLSPLPTVARRIIALYLSRPIERDAYRSAIDEPAKSPAEPLQPIMSAARAMDLAVEPMSFVSRDIPSDIARSARVRQADLILMGFHKPVFGQAILGGTVHRVLTGSDCDVAVFVDRERFGPLEGERPLKILVPYMGGKHDRLALDLAGRIARRRSSELVVLHVIPPNRSADDATINARGVVDKAYSDPTQPTPVRFQVIEDAAPVDAVIQHGHDFDLVVIGVEEEWGLESHLFGWRPERVARECPASMLIVRKATPIGGTRTKPDEAWDVAEAKPKESGSSASTPQTPASVKN
jgi:nucleotide-binding universal stress UspA family protein